MRKLILAGMGLMALSATAQAADNGVYFGLSLGQATIQQKEDYASALGSARIDFDADDMGFKVIAGVRPLDWLGVEANYVNFGELEDTAQISLPGQANPIEVTNEAEGYGIAGYLVGFIPVGPVDVFGKFGLVSWDTKNRIAGDVEWDEADGEDLSYGVGAQFRLLSLGVRAEYEIYDIDGVDDANLISIGVTYTFL